jgi:AraC family transcriptional regulator of adaptative response / DNA-3-methyladenine glycosylase II
VDASDRITLRLSYRPPFDWTKTLTLLSREAVPRVERAANGGYARTLRGASGLVWVEIAACPATHALLLHVRGGGPADLFDIAGAARRVFDLAADPLQIALALRDDELLGPSICARPATRLLGVWTRFEAIVRAILRDEVGSEGVLSVAGRLADRFGTPIPGEETDLTRLFPGPRELASADLEAIGLDRSPAELLRAAARAVLDGTVRLDGAADRVMHELTLIPGFGASRAQWVGLRGYGEPDAFPAEDPDLSGLLAAKKMEASGLELRAEAWRPWRGYGYFHLSMGPVVRPENVP